jgi:hypothetical protein
VRKGLTNIAFLKKRGLISLSAAVMPAICVDIKDYPLMSDRELLTAITVVTIFNGSLTL